MNKLLRIVVAFVFMVWGLNIFPGNSITSFGRSQEVEEGAYKILPLEIKQYIAGFLSISDFGLRSLIKESGLSPEIITSIAVQLKDRFKNSELVGSVPFDKYTIKSFADCCLGTGFKSGLDKSAYDKIVVALIEEFQKDVDLCAGLDCFVKQALALIEDDGKVLDIHRLSKRLNVLLEWIRNHPSSQKRSDIALRDAHNFFISLEENDQLGYFFKLLLNLKDFFRNVDDCINSNAAYYARIDLQKFYSLTGLHRDLCEVLNHWTCDGDGVFRKIRNYQGLLN